LGLVEDDGVFSPLWKGSPRDSGLALIEAVGVSNGSWKVLDSGSAPNGLLTPPGVSGLCICAAPSGWLSMAVLRRIAAASVSAT
jgi:hypothetical protein